MPDPFISRYSLSLEDSITYNHSPSLLPLEVTFLKFCESQDFPEVSHSINPIPPPLPVLHILKCHKGCKTWNQKIKVPVLILLDPEGFT